MDIYDYLKLDHEKVAQLFKQFEKSPISARKQQIAALISQELLVHAHSEQATFYTALKQFKMTKDDALHGQKEHQEIEDQIKLILHSKEFGSSWVKKVNTLKDLVEHHVKEEEGTIFKQAKKVLSKEEAYILKEQMHYLKQHLLLSQQKENSSTVKKEHKIKKAATATKKTTLLNKKQALKKNESGSTRIHH